MHQDIGENPDTFEILEVLKNEETLMKMNYK